MDRDFIISAFRNVRRRFIRHGGDDEEDALQDAFCRLWSRKDRFSSQCEAEGFLSVTVRNITVDGHRRRSAHPEIDIESIDPVCDSHDESDESSSLLIEVNRLIEKNLTPRDREILQRRDRDGWEFDEIAEYYEVSEANARMIVSRARKTIRELYRKRHGI